MRIVFAGHDNHQSNTAVDTLASTKEEAWTSRTVRLVVRVMITDRIMIAIEPPAYVNEKNGPRR